MGNKAAGRPPGGQGRKDDEPVVETPPARPNTGNNLLDQTILDIIRLQADVKGVIASAAAAQSSADLANSAVVRLTNAMGKLGEALAVQSESVNQLREELKRKRAPKADPELEDGDEEETEAPDWYSVETERQAQLMLDGLIEWVAKVYLRGPHDAKLTYCWMWHPEVVDELVALRWSYFDAHHGETANGFKASDWRDRYRKSAIERINTALAQCNLGQHEGPDGARVWQPLRTVPGVDDVNPAAQVVAVAEWWATRRESTPPAPSANLKAAEKASRVRPAD